MSLPLARLGSLTQAANSPVAPSKCSISWLSLVVPSAAVNRRSKPSLRALAASSASDDKLMRTGKLVRLPAICDPKRVMGLRNCQLQPYQGSGVAVGVLVKVGVDVAVLVDEIGSPS